MQIASEFVYKWIGALRVTKRRCIQLTPLLNWNWVIVIASWDGPSSTATVTCIAQEIHRVGDSASGLDDEEGTLDTARGFLAYNGHRFWSRSELGKPRRTVSRFLPPEP